MIVEGTTLSWNGHARMDEVRVAKRIWQRKLPGDRLHDGRPRYKKIDNHPPHQS